MTALGAARTPYPVRTAAGGRDSPVPNRTSAAVGRRRWSPAPQDEIRACAVAAHVTDLTIRQIERLTQEDFQ
jgi:hypothetical protein